MFASSKGFKQDLRGINAILKRHLHNQLNSLIVLFFYEVKEILAELSNKVELDDHDCANYCKAFQ